MLNIRKWLICILRGYHQTHVEFYKEDGKQMRMSYCMDCHKVMDKPKVL